LVLHSNNTVHFSQFGDIVISSKASLGTFGAQINNANIEITFTPTSDSFVSNINLTRNLLSVNDVQVFEGDVDLQTANLGSIDLGLVDEDATISQDLGSV